MIEGALVRTEYDIRNNEPNILMWIRTKEDERKSVRITDPPSPYFYTTGEPYEHKNIENIEKTDKKALYSKSDVWKIETDIPKSVGKLRSKFGPHHEADILYPMRYLIDTGLKYGVRIDDNKNIEPIDCDIEPKKVYLDIETIEEEATDRIDEAPFEINVIGCYIPSKDERVQFILDNELIDNRDTVIKFQNERELIKDFIEYIRDEDPDMIIGKYLKGFDMPYLYNRAKRLDIEIEDISPIGRIRNDRNFKVGGRDVLDWEEYYDRKKDTEPESHRLHDILEDELGWEPVDIDDFEHCWFNNPERLLERNKHDIEGPAKISEKLNIIKFFNELRKLVGCKFKDTRFMGKLADYYYLRRINDTKWVAPSKKTFGSNKSFSGAKVLEPKRGRWERVIVVDLSSAYPSLMRTFNISPETFIFDDSDKDKYQYISMDEAEFRTDVRGIIPKIQEDLLEERNSKKKLMKESKTSEEENMYHLEQRAIKYLANSFYGLLGDPKSRYFKYVIAEGVTGVIRRTIEEVAQELEKQEYNVVFGDTDSVGASDDKEDPQVLVDKANEIIDNFMLERYGVEDHQIRMDLDKIYKAMIIREKKLYAGKLQDGTLVKKGIASRRSDTAPIARRLQENMLNQMLEGMDKEVIINDLKEDIDLIKDGKYGLKELGVPTKFKKNPTDYEKSNQRYKIYDKGKKYQNIEFSKGDKPKRVICKTVGAVAGWDDTDLKDLEIDYNKMVEKYIEPKIRPFLEIYGIDWENSFEGQEKLDNIL